MNNVASGLASQIVGLSLGNIIAIGVAVTAALLLQAMVWWRLPRYVERWFHWIDSRVPADLSAYAKPVSRLIIWVVALMLLTATVLAVLTQLGVDTSGLLSSASSTAAEVGRWAGSRLPRIGLIVVIAVIVSRVVNRVTPTLVEQFLVRGDDAAAHTGVVERRVRTLTGVLTRSINFLVLAVSFFIVLDALGFSISPLLAGLGIGGIAVALALQPVLSNTLASTYIVSDGAINVGDYIELESGVRGYVTELGWRTTKVRTPFNNMVIIPNSRLSDAIITNYFAPTSDMWVMVTGGVSYESDLDHVERVALEVAREVIRECPGAVKDAEPWFGFDNFGDSNIDFWFFIQAVDRLGTFAVKSDMVKRLHQRFRQEGIEINYPVRRLVFPPRNGAPSAMEAQEVVPPSATPRRRTRRPRDPLRS